MHANIDKFGRVVIPIAIRMHLGLLPGQPVEVEERDSEIVIKVLEEPQVLEKKAGVLVYTGELHSDLDAYIKKQREQRIKDLGEF